MAHPEDRTRKALAAAGLESISDRFHALSFETNKPDAREFFDLNSPVSPLPTRPLSTVTPSSSSSSSGSSITAKLVPNAAAAAAAGGGRKPEVGIAGRRSHSGELLLGSNDTGLGTIDGRTTRPGHRRSGSGPLIYSGTSVGASAGVSAGSSTASSPLTNVLPAGNICPSGRISKTGMMSRNAARSDVLGSGTGNYGHGSIVRGGTSGAGSGKPPGCELAVGNAGDPAVRRAMASTDPEEVKRVGNEQYKRGHFADALRLYDRAIAMCPDNAACHSNRAAALTGLKRLVEAVKECEQAVRLDPAYGRAHQRLASLLIRLGQVDDARRHLLLAGSQPNPVELQKLQAVERHLGRCADARKIGDWKSALRESDAGIAAGADSSSLLLASRAESLLRLHQLEEAELAISNASKLESSSSSCSNTKFVGMLSNSFVHFVRAQVEMALGRFENAVSAAERAKQIDPGNLEVTAMLNNVRSVAQARALGNELFNSGKFAEACLAYGEGLKYDPSNPVLYCNRAACRSKLGQWEKSIEDCNEAVRIQPNYTKALLRRAASNSKLERWAEAVRDYEILRQELPGNTEVAEALFHAQVALRTSRGEEVSNMKFGGEVEEITGAEQFQAAITLPGVSVVHFMAALNQNCSQITPFVNALCTRYPSLNFLKVDVNENPAVARAENVRIVPTFKIYKNGTRVKEMICPSQQVLEYSVKHYGF
ncbi:LOW QUALITY PROTEIN: TPR repeat-containing thioredoxin TTL1-like [Phoenix dactylifera]|uniref:LOW QUALITY PROTEIN: TPR repeat-containing thioredoxin TTL1-like n=1 Tax=Phoenix dactylifera TaxID=42345 RepID=A0A8B7BRH6_PHODC|nr:LOW QUALITY PROTEIN: TPR repeat-containing thioredoxin TTL1-like [Phoenix dactylifera]